MNWTGGRRTKIQANVERMQQRRHFDRQRRLTMATYVHDLQQRSSVISVSLPERYGNASTTKHRDSQYHAMQSSLEPSNSVRSTRGDTEMAAQDIILGIRDYDSSRKACLELLASPTFDLIGEPFHLRQSRLLEHKPAPSNLTTHRKRRTGGKVSAKHENARSEYSFSADEEEEDEEDEPLQVPPKHRALCQELRTKRGQIDVDAEDVPMDPDCMIKQEPVSDDPSHATDITREKDQENTLQAEEILSNTVQAPEHLMTERFRSITAQHKTDKLREPLQDDLVPVSLTQQNHTMTLQSVASSTVIPATPAPTLAAKLCATECSTPIDKSTGATAETPIQTTTHPLSRQSPPATGLAITGHQETNPVSSDPQENNGSALELQVSDSLPMDPDLPCTEVPVTSLQSQEFGPGTTTADEAEPQAAYTSSTEQPTIAPRPVSSRAPTTVSLSFRTTEAIETALQPTEAKGEVQRIELRASPATSAPRAAEPSSFAHGSTNLLEQQQDDFPEPTDIQEAKHQPMKMYSQSIPSEMDVQLYSDEETPYQNSTYNNNTNINSNNADEDYVNEDDISPIVSTQHSFSRQSSLFSATPDWPPANQEEAARRLALLQERLLASSTAASYSHPGYGHVHVQRRYSEIAHTPRSNDFGYNYGYDHNLMSNMTTGSARDPALMQGQEQRHGHDSLIRLPSDPKDMDALSSILDSQDAFGFGFDLESGLGGGGEGYVNAGGEVMRGGRNAFDPNMNLFADGSSSEWIGSEEWNMLDNAHVDQNPYY
ncbi:hypothetical protein BGW39_008047 [Mortierella sp. 14UC]|nr:hypothetical protein BGW39_008047 [Mortierella sp. 14UC]